MRVRLYIAVFISLLIAGCGGGAGGSGGVSSGGDGTSVTSSTESDGGTTLGETGSSAGTAEQTGSTVASSDFRPASLPAGTLDPSFIIIAKVNATTNAAVVSGTAAKGGTATAGALVTATLTRDSSSAGKALTKFGSTPTTIGTQTTLTSATGAFALSFAAPKNGDVIYAVATKDGQSSNTVKLEIDIFGKVDELGNPLFGVGGANNIGPGTFNSPEDVVFLASQHQLFVADRDNHRVLVFDLKAAQPKFAQSVLCQSHFVAADPGSGTSGCYYPTSLALDATGLRLFVADLRGIKVFDISGGVKSGMAAKTTIGEGCSAASQSFGGRPDGIAYDAKNQRLFAADGSKNRILVFNVNNPSTCMSAAAVIGQPNFTVTMKGGGTTGLYNPTDVAWQENTQRLYALDAGNSRILVYDVPASMPETGLIPSYVIGRAGFSTDKKWWEEGLDTLQQVTTGRSLSLSPDGQFIYVGETYWDNQRGEYGVLKRFPISPLKNTPAADICIGRAQNSCSQEPTTIPSGKLRGTYFGITALTDPDSGDLFVADGGNNRILFFAPAARSTGTTAAAKDCLGQLKPDGTCDLTTLGANAVSTSSFNTPEDIALDEDHNRIFVADMNNARVVVYNGKRDSQGGLVLDDRLADYSLGSVTGFAPAQPTGSASELLQPRSLAYKNGLLFVGDGVLDRVSVFEVDGTLTSGMAASYALGDTTFRYKTVRDTIFPTSMAIDCNGRYLFYYDTFESELRCIDLEEGGISLRSRINTYKSSGTMTGYTIKSTGLKTTGSYVPFAFGRDSCHTFYFGKHGTYSDEIHRYDYSGGCTGFTEKSQYIDAGYSPNSMAVLQSDAYVMIASSYFNAIPMAFMEDLKLNNAQIALRNLIGQSSFQERSASTAEGRFNNPHAIRCTSDDRYCYVADTGNNRGAIIKNPLCQGISPPKTGCP